MKPPKKIFEIPLLLISTICAVHVSAQELYTDISEILQAVQKNVDSQKERLIDILSKEEITLEEFDNKGELAEIANIISDYRVFPGTINKISDCRVLYSEILEFTRSPGILREERVILSTENNGWIEKKSYGDFWAKGNTYVDLFSAFDKQNEKCFDYKFIGEGKISLTGTGKIKERNVYAIEIKHKETNIGQTEKLSWVLKHGGIALIDVGTMEIVRLSRSVNYHITYNNFSTNWRGRVFALEDQIEKYVYSIEYEYDKVKIGDQFLTLPLVKIAKIFRENGQLAAVYTYRYRDHRAFNASVKISFDEIQGASN